jgi:hypothetical protein
VDSARIGSESESSRLILQGYWYGFASILHILIADGICSHGHELGGARTAERCLKLIDALEG